MTFETKFNVGDIVYTLSQEIRVHKISRVAANASAGRAHVSITYDMVEHQEIGTNTHKNSGASEKDLFSTKAEAAEAWLAKNQLNPKLKRVENVA